MIQAAARRSPFIHNANVALHRRLLAESKRDPSRDEDRHNMLRAGLEEQRGV
jgi:hypothetical protein